MFLTRFDLMYLSRDICNIIERLFMSSNNTCLSGFVAKYDIPLTMINNGKNIIL